MVPFTHLHVHTDASLKDGLGTVERLVAGAKQAGFEALAMTDHGTLTNAIVFSNTCKAYGIKPILGIEAYVSVQDKIGHMTLLADGDIGFENLISLNNRGKEAQLAGNKHPIVSVEDLETCNEDLVLLTGCVSSPLYSLPEKDSLDLFTRLLGIFGTRMFAEVMFVADTDTWSKPLHLSSILGIKPVLTNDAHFPYHSDSNIHATLTGMKAGFSYNSSELWLKPGETIIRRGVKKGVRREALEKMADTAYRIGKQIRTPDLQHEFSFPVELSDGELYRKFLDTGFRFLSSRRFRGGGEFDTYHNRLKNELHIISRMGYLKYFYILDDIVSHAKDVRVPIGPGRGSGAGSLLLYTLGVTDVDPIKYNLSFERFLNPAREGMPDVDIDFCSRRRDEVISYAAERWGAVPIATYSKYSHKILVHDLCKQLRVPRDLDEEAAEYGRRSEAFKRIEKDYPSFGECYDAFYGQIRHKGKHAGGVIITDRQIPIEISGKTRVAAWVEGARNDLSYAGLVKFDLLGLSALTILDDIKRAVPSKIEDESVASVFEIFQKGNLDGIFQFSGSTGIRDLTMKVHPTSFDDLVAVNALYRPGALDVGSASKYVSWKRSPRKVPALLEDILAPTYGAIVFQEQVMAIFARVTGGSFAEADLARRVIVKSKTDDPEWESKVESLRKQFFDGAKKADLPSHETDKLWNEIFAHARYSFNRAHAVSYTKIAFEMAKYKHVYPVHFYAALLNVDLEYTQRYIVNAQKNDVPITTFSVNKAPAVWTARDGSGPGDMFYLSVPMSAVRYLSPTAARFIRRERVANGPFKSIANFMERIPKKIVRAQAREGLLMTDFFTPLEYGIKDVPIKDGLETAAKILQLSDKSLARMKKIEEGDQLRRQLEYFGFIIPGKPFIEAVEKMSRKSGIQAGVVSSVKQKESSYGAYYVHYLSPSGAFWSREEKIPEGSAIKVQVNKKNGKLIRWRNITEEEMS